MSAIITMGVVVGETSEAGSALVTQEGFPEEVGCRWRPDKWEQVSHI